MNLGLVSYPDLVPFSLLASPLARASAALARRDTAPRPSSRGDMPLFPPPNAAIQQQLGINVTEHLQDGASKSVYACAQSVGGASNAVVAIESMTQAAEPEAVRRLVSRPLHPNIVRGIAHLHAAGLRYTVSERLQVELFDNVVTGGPITEGPARGIFAQCVAALRHMHRVGVAHRDIKLENMMFSAQQGAAAAVLKMIDFDLSEIAPTLAPPAPDVFGPRLSTTRAGSRSYCAPEVVAGMGPHDMFLADVWSLGVVLFTMATGFFFVDVAADHDPRFAVAQQAQQAGLSTVAAIYAMYSRPNLLSAPLVALLDGMLTINPAQRTTLDQIAAAPVGTCGSVHDVGPERACWAQGCTHHRSGAAQLLHALLPATISAASCLPTKHLCHRAGSWLATMRAQLTQHDDVVPVAPELWRLRARPHMRRFRRWVAAIGPVLLSYQRAVERTLRPGAPGALAAQQHFEDLAPVYDSMSAADSTSATLRGLSADPSDLAVPIEEPSGGESDALRALVKRVLESMGLESVEPPPLKRQNAEDVAHVVARISGTLKRKALG